MESQEQKTQQMDEKKEPEARVSESKPDSEESDEAQEKPIMGSLVNV